jgi:molybdate transport system substrate-binding protein
VRFRSALAFLLVVTGVVMRGETELTVSAAASLNNALIEIRTLHSKAHPDVTIVYNIGGSGQLQQQIESGAPVDVFISAAPAQMDALEKKGLLLTDTRRDLLSNTLVLVTPKNSTIKGFADLTHPEVRRIAIGDPKSVPVGAYAAQVFKSLNIIQFLEPKLVRVLDARQVLTAVETGNVEAGVVYLTDAKSSARARIAATAPEKSHSPIIYPGAVIKQSRHPDAARQFLDFLGDHAARAVFAKSGFGMAP